MDSEQTPSSSSDFEELQDLIIQSFRRRFILGKKKNRERRRFRASDPDTEGSNRKLILNFFRKLEEFTGYVEYFQNTYFDPDEESVSIGKEKAKASSCPMPGCHCETSSATTPSLKEDTSSYSNFSMVRDILLNLSKSLKAFQKKSSLVLDSVEHGTSPDRKNFQFIHHIIQIFHVLVDFVKELLFRSSKSLKKSSITSAPAGENFCSCTTSEISNDDMAHIKADMLEWRRNLPDEKDDEEDGMTSSNEEEWVKSLLMAHEETNPSDPETSPSDPNPIPAKDIDENPETSATKSAEETESITISNELVTQLEETQTIIGSLTEDMNRFILGLDIPALDDVSLKTVEGNCPEESKNTFKALQDNNISSTQTVQTPDEVENPVESNDEDTRKQCKSGERVPEDQIPLLDHDTNVAVLINNDVVPTLYATDCLPFLCNLSTIGENRILETNPSISEDDLSHACKEQPINPAVTDIYVDEDEDKCPSENFCCAAPSNNIHECISEIDNEQEKIDEPRTPVENELYLVDQPGSKEFAMSPSHSQARGNNHADNPTKEDYRHIVSLDVTHFANVIKERMVQLHQEEIERGVPISGIENEFTVLTILSECIQQSFEIVTEDTSCDQQTGTSQNKGEQCNETPDNTPNAQFQVPEEELVQSGETDGCIAMDGLENEKFKNLKESFEKTMATLRKLSDESLVTRLSFDANQSTTPESDDCKSGATQENNQFAKLIGQVNKECAKCSRDRENYLTLVSTGFLSHGKEHSSRKPVSPEPHEHRPEQVQYFSDLVEVREVKETKIEIYVVKSPEGMQYIEKNKQIPFNKNASSDESRNTGLQRNDEKCHQVLEPKDSPLNAFQKSVLSLRYLKGPRLLLKVHSENFTEETFSLLMCSSPISLYYYKDIQVMFKDQQGKVIEDYALEQYFFFTLLAAHIFSVHDKKLFQPSGPESSSICLNPVSPMPRTWFRFAGVILAIALLHQKPLGVRLPQSFFKCLLDRELEIDDMQEIDPRLHRRLCWLERTKVSEYPACLSFTIDEKTADNRTLELEIIPDGKNVLVTDNNKADYIGNIVQWKLIGRFHAEMNDFKKGFNMVLDPALLSEFTVGELQNLVMTGYLED